MHSEEGVRPFVLAISVVMVFFSPNQVFLSFLCPKMLIAFFINSCVRDQILLFTVLFKEPSLHSFDFL